ncbi:amidohydrolase [Rubrivivax gelatinosus]|uniref:Amidohydrolase n=1 Tax=Rubrivivax gelatinosus TaxID=28068 RepID=A0ABS1DXY9_RUBGE|nr:amidohydrolase [Rubrivivax gelatinosus]MBK1714951.1 amidohydrolase [Rubrivivax gelatinosus]
MTEPGAAGWDCHVHVFDAAQPVPGGHYRPVDRPLAEIEALAQAHGVGHLVLVQPSVYGRDNTLLLRALAQAPGRHRGVVVLGDEVDDAELDTMHALGVRGLRFNLVSPVGERRAPAARLAALAPRLHRRGWHVQWYAGAADLPELAALHRGPGPACVLDHLAGLGTRVGDEGPAWRAVEELAAQGAWIKLSGWYRLDAEPPYAALVPRIRRLARLFGERMVWASDWPHTSFEPGALPTYESTWWPVVEALGADAAEALRRRRPAIYD